jgi:4-diphosphocytidyl-2-C-methyl-D-erythritol kinase
LAGGSTDAATVLKGLNILFNTKLTTNQLKALGSQIGTDVPFCLQGGTAYAFGRGDSLQQLPDIEKTHFVLITPPVEVSTPTVYAKYDKYQPEMEIPTQKLIKLIKGKKEIDWSIGWANVLEPVTQRLVPQIKEIEQILAINFSPEHVMMSGSGPSVYAVVKNKDRADYITNNCPREKDFISHCSTLVRDYSNLKKEV